MEDPKEEWADGRRERPELENLLIEIFLIPNLNPRDPSLDNLNELCYEYLDLLEKKALAYAAEQLNVMDGRLLSSNLVFGE